ncbi:pilin, type IV, putative [Deinococcus proteolyticus MRP]|uniref:Pilin, type IV, putative n=1 Tax=Deinococcus proteolyticus (strain ATCC 35074 / DSM 20540 / JCM 6276 / NBRC 101906 / NCIMB 13154 / VKM Ac-1939 / CCM 2703 / MRP) TaxID=693977 RepID=F0RNR3_DEIPM|nr:pilin, type IV, putative [Deinococcus proteolyticus MRP]
MGARWTQGMSLLELLIVMAVVGILLSIGWGNYNRAIWANEVTEQANMLARDLNASRSAAQRESQNITLSFSSNNYTFGPEGTPGTRRVLSNGITLQCITNCVGTLTYQAPFATLNDAMGRVYRLSSPHGGVAPVEVRVVGVTGKVNVVRGQS